jgi:hypothetical protein
MSSIVSIYVFCVVYNMPSSVIVIVMVMCGTL